MGGHGWVWLVVMSGCSCWTWLDVVGGLCIGWMDDGFVAVYRMGQCVIRYEDEGLFQTCTDPKPVVEAGGLMPLGGTEECSEYIIWLID